MKKQYVSLLALLLSVGGFYSSCTNKMNKNTGSLEFDQIKLNETIHLFGDTAKPGSNLTIDFTYAVKSSDKTLKDSINSYFIAASFGDEYLGDDIKNTVKQYGDQYFSEYRTNLEPMFLEDQKDEENAEHISSWYSYYRGVESRIQFYEGDLLVYRIDYNEYTGGAHGTYRSNFLNIDLHTIQPITLDDIFIGDYTEQITHLLWNQLMIDNNVGTREELEDMGYGLTGDLTPFKEFYLNKEGITFYYNIYDFTPYVMGTVEIKLPFAQLEHLLKNGKIINQLRK